LKERETLASTVTTLPSGMALLNARDLQMLLQQSGMSSAAILAARSIRANSPPKRLFKGFVSLGKTKSVSIVKDSEGYFDSYF
jgi:hypothetical protein